MNDERNPRPRLKRMSINWDEIQDRLQISSQKNEVNPHFSNDANPISERRDESHLKNENLLTKDVVGFDRAFYFHKDQRNQKAPTNNGANQIFSGLILSWKEEWEQVDPTGN